LSGGPVVLVLSGGGAKAAAHVGAVRAVLEAGLQPERYVATSMGAVVAAGLAGGLSADQVLDRLVSAGGSGIARRRMAPLGGLWAGSLMRAAPLRRAIERFLPVTRFTDLGVPLTVSATDLDSGERILFGSGGQDAPLADALMASCALARLYQATGRRNDAQAMLAPALEGFLPTPEMPEIAEAQALIGRLSVTPPR